MRPLLVYLPTNVSLNGLPILDWYGHCVHVSVNKLEGSGGMAPPGKCLKLGTLRSLLRPWFGTKKSTGIVVSAAREAIEPK